MAGIPFSGHVCIKYDNQKNSMIFPFWVALGTSAALFAALWNQGHKLGDCRFDRDLIVCRIEQLATLEKYWDEARKMTFENREKDTQILNSRKGLDKNHWKLGISSWRELTILGANCRRENSRNDGSDLKRSRKDWVQPFLFWKNSMERKCLGRFA